MYKDLWKKGLVFGIIVLFVEVSVVPSISGDIGKMSSAIDGYDTENKNNRMNLMDEPPDEEWNKTFGTNDNIDSGSSVQQTSDGGYIVLGRTQSYGAGADDVWLIKTDSNGDEIWNKTYGGSDDDYGWAFQKTNDDGYIITGYTRSYSVVGRDLWLIKTDSMGNEEWNKTFDSNASWDFDKGTSVQQTSDNGYIITGFTGYTSDVWLIKTDSMGNEEWSKTFGGDSIERGWEVQQTDDDGYVITGETQSYGNGHSASPDVWLIKTDSNGNEEWNKTYGGTNSDSGHSISITSDGNYIITGYTWSFGGGGRDVWLIKTDSSGNEIWSGTYGGSGAEEGLSVQQTNDDGYIMTGYTGSFSASIYDVWLIKADLNGTELWNLTFDLNDIEMGRSVRQTTDGGYIIAGATHCVADQPSYLWLIKVAPENGITKPDLYCDGTLHWQEVEPGSTVTGSFTVENIGDPESQLDWEIIEWPDWGDWSFDPDGGDDLLAGDSIIVDVEVVAPDEPEETFTGEIKIINSENVSDFCIIDVSLATPVNQQVDIHPLFQRILEQFPNAFPSECSQKIFCGGYRNHPEIKYRKTYV